MSRDYTHSTVRAGAASSLANGATVLGYVFSKDYDFLALQLQVLITAAEAGATTHTVKVQRSDSAGSFSSPTDLCSIALTSSNAVASMSSVRIDPEDSAVEAGALYALRIVHTASAGSSALAYTWEFAHTAVHE